MYLLSEKTHSRMDLIPPLLPSLSHQLGMITSQHSNSHVVFPQCRTVSAAAGASPHPRHGPGPAALEEDPRADEHPPHRGLREAARDHSGARPVHGRGHRLCGAEAGHVGHRDHGQELLLDEAGPRAPGLELQRLGGQLSLLARRV